jgi:hypothetical protein
VRTIDEAPGPPDPADAALAGVAEGRFSGVFSPSAANAAGASSSMPRTAVTADVKAGRSFITEGCAGSRM